MLWRYTVILLTLLAMLGIVATFNTVISRRDVITHAAPVYLIDPHAVVKVVCPMGYGSGVHLGEGRVLTAFHVVDHEPSACFVNGKPANVIYVDPQMDVAMLQADLGSLPAARWSCQGYAIDESYGALGYPMGGNFAAYVVQRRRGHDTPVDLGNVFPFPIFQGRVIPGMSGGPVVRGDGYVVGLINATGTDSSLLRDLRDTTLCTAFRAPDLIAS